MQDVDTMCLLFKTEVMPRKIFAFEICFKQRAVQLHKIPAEQMGLDLFVLAVSAISS